MIKAKIRWCSCRVENILTLGKFADPQSVPKAPGQSRNFYLYICPVMDTPKSLECPGNSPNEVAREK